MRLINLRTGITCGNSYIPKSNSPPINDLRFSMEELYQFGINKNLKIEKLSNSLDQLVKEKKILIYVDSKSDIILSAIRNFDNLAVPYDYVVKDSILKIITPSNSFANFILKHKMCNNVFIDGDTYKFDLSFSRLYELYGRKHNKGEPTPIYY